MIRGRARLARSGEQGRRPAALARRLLRLSQFSRDAASAESDEDVFRLAVRAALEVLGCLHASVLGLDRRAGVLRVAAAVGLKPLTVERFALPAERGVAGAALRQRRPLAVQVSRDRRFVRFDWQEDRFDSLLCVPLFTYDSPVGVLCAGGSREGFSADQMQLASVLGHLTVAALEHKRLLRQAERRLQEVDTLLKTSGLLQASGDLQAVLEGIVREAVRGTRDGECGWLWEVVGEGRLVLRAGLSAAHHPSSGPAASQPQYALTVVRERRGMLFHRMQEVPGEGEAGQGDDGRSPAVPVLSAVAVPLVLGARVVGVLAVESHRLPEAFDKDNLRLLAGLASSAAIAMERSCLDEQRRHLYRSGIHTLVAAIDARDPSAQGHSDRVAYYGRRIAQVMGVAPEWVERIELAALLHDVGKIGIADSVLRKPGPLEPAERAVMMAHVELGARILAANEALADLVPLVRHHHEWYSGGGYPEGLSGDAIPLGAAIISVADAFDTMTTGRPYRPALSLEEAVAELRRCSGSQFRPDVVEALIRALAEDEQAGVRLAGQKRAAAVPLSPDGAAAAPGPPGSGRAAAGSLASAGRITPAQARELVALYRMAQLVRDIVDLPGLLQHVLRIVHSELGMADSCILLVDDETGELVMQAASGSFVGFEGLRLRLDQGISGWVARHGQPVLVSDVSRDPRYYPGPPTTQSELVVPLISSGRVLGALAVDSPVLNAFSGEEVEILATVAQQAAVAIEVAKLHEQARRAALRDGLTNLFNHRYFYERLEEELGRASRYGYGLQVAIGDVNLLKDVNDNLGHLAGDAVLARLGRLLRRHCRRYDVVARYGGDEFGIIMAQTDRAGALQTLARLDGAVAQATFDWYGLKLQLPGISWGVAGYPEDGQRPAELVAAADARMYLAKRERQLPHLPAEPAPEGASRESLEAQHGRRLPDGG